MNPPRWRGADGVCLAAIALGVALVGKGLTYPVYWNRALASELKHAACAGERVSQSAMDALASLRTPRHEVTQTGLSVALGALALWGILLFFRDSAGRMTTPRSRPEFYALGLGVIALSFISQIHSFELDMARDDILMCQNTMGVGLGLLVVYCVITLICLGVSAIATGYFGTIPAHLWQWDRDDLPRSVILTLLILAAATVIALLAILGAPTSAFLGTPAAVVALYLLESTRSAILAQDEATDATD